MTAKVVAELGGDPREIRWESIIDAPAAFLAEAHRHNASEIDDLPSGGGGADIDDTTAGTDTTWSSQRTSDELAGKAPAGWSSILDIFGGSWDHPVETGLPIQQGLDETFLTAYRISQYAIAISLELSYEQTIQLVTELPPSPDPGVLYMVRAADGTVTWHLPTLWV
ncbi:hypothetical protein LCL87_03515 [Rhodococcus hoagii]|nr:hypothetical protein [Prescottella equi]